MIIRMICNDNHYFLQYIINVNENPDFMKKMRIRVNSNPDSEQSFQLYPNVGIFEQTTVPTYHVTCIPRHGIQTTNNSNSNVTSTGTKSGPEDRTGSMPRFIVRTTFLGLLFLTYTSMSKKTCILLKLILYFLF